MESRAATSNRARGFDFPATVTVRTQPGWLVATGMASGPAPGSYREGNYHDLVDMPFFVGRIDVDSQQVDGRWNRLATYPAGAMTGPARALLWDQIGRMTPPMSAVFQETPWRTYTTLLVFQPGLPGGSALEHGNSHVGIYNPGFIGSPLLASITGHEIFHAWNVKRLRPADKPMITDHALLRYIERVHGVDFEAFLVAPRQRALDAAAEGEHRPHFQPRDSLDFVDLLQILRIGHRHAEDRPCALSPHGEWFYHPRWGYVWSPARVGNDFRPYYSADLIGETQLAMLVSNAKVTGYLRRNPAAWGSPPAAARRCAPPRTPPRRARRIGSTPPRGARSAPLRSWAEPTTLRGRFRRRWAASPRRRKHWV